MGRPSRASVYLTMALSHPCYTPVHLFLVHVLDHFLSQDVVATLVVDHQLQWIFWRSVVTDTGRARSLSPALTPSERSDVMIVK